MENSQHLPVIGANDVSNYVVCPEAWRLKYQGFGEKYPTEEVAVGKKLRQDWAKEHDLATQLRTYTKIAYLLLVALVIVVFLLDQHRENAKINSGLGSSTVAGTVENLESFSK